MILKPVKCCIGYKTTNKSETKTKIYKTKKIDKFSFLYFDFLIYTLYIAVEIKKYKKNAHGINAPLDYIFYYCEYNNKCNDIKRLKDVLKENIKELNETIKLDYFEAIGIDYYLMYRNILKRLYRNLKRSYNATIKFTYQEYRFIIDKIDFYKTTNARENVYY